MEELIQIISKLLEYENLPEIVNYNEDKDGKVIATKKVGSPDIVRKGICDYKIERIMCDESEQKFIFIVEKILEDETGISIRYMVEAAEID